MTADAGGVGAPRFDVVLRGYDRRQVDEHVARLQRVVSRMRADLEMVRSQPIPVVQAPPPGFGGPGPGPGPGRQARPTPRPRPDEPDMIGSFTDRMQSILQAAEDEAAEIRNKARAGARAESESVRAELADVVRQRDAVLVELKRLRGQLEGMLSAPTARMAVAPRDGGSSVRPAQPASGASKPGQPSGPERSALAGGPPKPRPAPSLTGPPQGPGQQPGFPHPAAAQANPPRPGASPQQPTSPQQSTSPPPAAAPRPASAQQLSGPTPPTAPQSSNPPSSTPQSSTPPSSTQPSSSPQSTSAQPGASQVAGQQPAAAQSNTQPPNAKSAPSTGGEAGQNGTPLKAQNGAAPQNGAARGPAGKPAPSGPQLGDVRPPASDAVKAAHRLPTGAYPAVAGEQPSMRPRSEPEPEPGDLFRPSAKQARDAQPAARKPGDVEATVKVGLVRPVAAQSDRTVLSPIVPPAEKKDAAKDAPSDQKRPDGDGSAGPGHPDRSTSTSRSG